jgi:hypothetical protein
LSPNQLLLHYIGACIGALSVNSDASASAAHHVKLNVKQCLDWASTRNSSDKSSQVNLPVWLSSVSESDHVEAVLLYLQAMLMRLESRTPSHRSRLAGFDNVELMALAAKYQSFVAVSSRARLRQLLCQSEQRLHTLLCLPLPYVWWFSERIWTTVLVNVLRNCCAVSLSCRHPSLSPNRHQFLLQLLNQWDWIKHLMSRC